ncbi:MAG: phosphomannomutase [Sphingobacteriales bacterium]|jgi:phosphomannomutase
MSAPKIKFGTDGWRAEIAIDYTIDNVARVTEATANWLLEKGSGKSVVIGHDCRFAGQVFAEAAAWIFAQKGIKVHLAKGYVSTPMVSLGVVKSKADLGIVITASHNPPSYNGFKIKGHFGGPLQPELIQEIEDVIPDVSSFDPRNRTLIGNPAEVVDIDLEGMYLQHVEENFDLDLIKKSGLRFAYDAMYGAGQSVMKKILPDCTFLHCNDNPGFRGQAPEPIHRNLQEFSDLIKNDGNMASGLATDGDADRIGLYNSKGEFVDSHHIILLLIQYLFEEKKMNGKVVTAFSVSPRITALCKHFGLEQIITKIGFKYVSGIMLTDDVLLGGEESGGIAIKGHIPERDGIWMGLVVWEYMAKSGKSLEQLINDVYSIVGSFTYNRIDMHITDAQKQAAIAACERGAIKEVGKRIVRKIETIDGFKFHFDNNEWLMIRPSGTEPVLRVYAEAENMDFTNEILENAREYLLNV